MSHLIEEYAKNLGVKISKPIVSKHFWPVVDEKYITICASANIPSKTYKYYELVLSFIKPALKQQGIKIFQIGSGKNCILPNVDKTFFDVPFKNLAYILSRSKLHIGSDEVYSHYAGSVDVPLVSLIAHAYPDICKPFWSKNQIVLKGPWKVKPCFNVEDPDDYINKIKPEEIAEAILKQLNMHGSLGCKTKFIGQYFDKKILEVVPNFFQPIAGLDKEHIFMRTDLGYDANSFVNWCRYLNSFTLFLNKPIEQGVLSQIKSKVKNISFVIENDATFSEQYLESIRKLNIPINLLILDEEKIGYFRNKFFDFSVDVYSRSSKKELGEDFKFDETYFVSSKTIFADNITYPSKFHFDQKNSVDNTMKLLDNEALLEELTHFYIYERTK